MPAVTATARTSRCRCWMSSAPKNRKFAAVEDYMAVKPLLEALPERDRQVLIMRFFEFQPQIRIAESFGVSQMQISRTLSRTLKALREQALRD
ncbi:sigma-70 family RNA polymerase sigma factor [Nocardia sp. SYP-A9097]|uniref:sigma-70 family RNA polymerase sigma factor n=1 Tax=Nocardia sp. SYP-A9097 TaxID=2663237 RepID=UPI0035C9343F